MTADTKPAVTIEHIQRSMASPYPYTVNRNSYQFKDLEAARDMAKKIGTHTVEMSHRSIELKRTATDDKGKSEYVVQKIILDVTTDSPEEAEAKFKP